MITMKGYEKNRYKYRQIIRFSLFAIFSVVAFIADIVFESNTNTSLNTLTQVMLSSVLVLAGFWISCYFLLLQFYKNRYPLEIIKSIFLKTVTTNISNIVIITIWGSILVGYGGGFISQLFFALVSISIIIYILISTYESNKTLMINTYVNKYTDGLKEQLQHNILKHKELDEIFEKMERLFEECFVKEEFYICHNISNNISAVFITLISECNKMIIEKNVSEDEVDYFFNKVILYSMYQIELAKECTSEYFIDSLIDQHKKNLFACIQTKQFNLYKKYIDAINRLIYQLQKNDYNTVVEIIFNLYKKISKKLIQSNCELHWIRFLIDECFNMTMSLNYVQRDTNLKYFIDLITYCMKKSLNDNINNNSEKYNYLFEKFREFSVHAAKINHSFKNIVVYYAHYSFYIIENGDINKIKDYLKLIDEIKHDLIVDGRWLDYVFFFLRETNKKWPNEFTDKNRERNVEILLDLISTDIKPNGNILLPEFQEIVNNNLYNGNAIRNIANDFYKLFSRSIIKNNTGIFYLFTEELNDCITSLESRSKNIQIRLFDIYIYILSEVSNIDNRLFTEITLSQLGKCIKQLDKENKISSDFGNYIINEMTDLVTKKFEISEDLSCKIVEFMFRFINDGEELNFILKDKDKLKLLYKSIFNIGMSNIENNYETSLRCVSNAMGWMILGSIKRGQGDLTKYLLERAIEIFNIAKNMNISEKTLTFIMTLFTTIGTYCYKEPHLYSYRKLILEELKTVDIGIITTAIKLRTSENNTWNDLFDNKTEELTKQFLNDIYKSRQ
ncbi:MAG: hypothetical protein GX323_01010 [Clostridiales bacterium]|nr:hypothetical protein [Clostridiales bacterium]